MPSLRGATLHQNSPDLIFFGCGALILAIGTSTSNFIDPQRFDDRVAIHNISVWLFAICQLAGAIAYRKKTNLINVDAKALLGFAYLFSAGIVWATKAAASEDLLPPFFIQGHGGTLLRQIVLLTAIVMFSLSAALLRIPGQKSTAFRNWYALALWLISVGLFGVMLQESVASTIGWAGRAAQYLFGGLCMLVAVVASVRDASAWRLTIEDSLRESERRERERTDELTALLDAAPTPVFIAHDADCRHITGNRAAEGLLRSAHGGEASLSAPEDVRPRHFRAVKDGRELRTDELPAQRAATGEKVTGFEFSLVFDDDDVREVLSYGTPLLDDTGRSRGSVVVLADVTAGKSAENRLRDSEERLRLAWQATRDVVWDLGCGT